MFNKTYTIPNMNMQTHSNCLLKQTPLSSIPKFLILRLIMLMQITKLGALMQSSHLMDLGWPSSSRVYWVP